MTPNDIKNYYIGREEDIIDSIRRLVDVESPSGDEEANKHVVDMAEEMFAVTGVSGSVERIKAAGYGEHLLITAFPGDAKPVLLLGHLDTVHPIGTKEQLRTEIKEGRFYGCGIFDMKANVVLMIEALRFFHQNGVTPARPINILLSCDEEVGSKTGREYVEREAAIAAHCFVFEPSAAGRVKTGRKGTGMYTVRAHGVPAHAGLEPEKGASAILELSRQIERLHSLNDVSVGTTVNVCTASGGTTTNVIPEHAECTVDVRFTSMAEAEKIDKVISSLSSIDERVSLEITGGINRPPMERTDAVIALYEKARDIAASLDYDLGETQVGGASDGNFVGALGIPVLDGLGIAGDGAHTLHEHILVSAIADRAALITLLLNNV